MRMDRSTRCTIKISFKRMKKCLFVFNLMLWGGLSHSLAQPVLTDAVNPVIGDGYILASGNYVSPGNPGANQTWDLSGIVATSSSTYLVGPIVSAPSYVQFSNNSNIQMNDGNTYSFFDVDSSRWQNSGLLIPAQGASVTYLNNEDILRFPFSMNDNFTSIWSATFSLSAINYARTGTTTVTYDGYGTLTLPGYTLYNTSRLHLVEQYVDMSLFNTTNVINDQYIWLIENVHQPVARLSSISVDAPATTSQYGYYGYSYSLVTAIQTQNGGPVSRLNCFPNPASDFITFAWEDQAVTRIQLIDPFGKVICSEAFGPSSDHEFLHTLKLAGIAAGIYTARVTSQNGFVSTQKVSVLK